MATDDDGARRKPEVSYEDIDAAIEELAEKSLLTPDEIRRALFVRYLIKIGKVSDWIRSPVS